MKEARTLKGHNKNNVNSFLNRVQMKRIWNTFCEDISKNKGVKEMTFEKEIVKGFLQALGWSRYDGNLEEQYGLYNRKWIPDFVFYLNNDKNAKEIILELKKPDHKQRKVDIEQKDLYGETDITAEHVQNNRSVRGMLGQRGLRPESLPPAEEIKKVERRVAKDEKEMQKETQKLPKK